MTKKQEGMLRAYENATATELWQVYGIYSQAKVNALRYCRELQARLNGHDGRICSANTFQFTYAFKYEDFDTGHMCLCYCTAANDYKFAID